MGGYYLMQFVLDFINQYGLPILYAVLTAFGAWLGTQIKGIYDRYITDKRAREVVEIAVKAVEQIYHACDGETKYAECVKAASEMLANKGIVLSELELKMLIESAVASFNYGFGGKKEYVLPPADIEAVEQEVV